MVITDKLMAEILNDILIIVDTREQKNEHILEWLKENHIPYVVEKLDTADYSFRLPNFPELALDKSVLVEKKNSLDEIIGNFTRDRERFAREFERVDGEHIHLVIEGATWKKVVKGSYRSKMNPKSIVASILTWSIRYNVKTWFVGVDESPMLIYNIIRYELMEKLKEMK